MADEEQNLDEKKTVTPDQSDKAPVVSGEQEEMVDEDLAEALGEIESTEDVDVDQALSEADPLFEADLAEISHQDFSGVVIEKENLSDEVDENAAAPSAYKALWDNIPKETKNRYYIAGGVMALLLPFALLIYNGKILPQFELPYVLNMGELSQEIYSYPVEGVQVPLFDDFRTQAHTVQFPKTVINLASTGGTPSYGEFEFSLVLRDEDLSVAIKAKESEIIDLMQRVLEQITWKELQSPIGKEKVKKVIRHRINEYLQGNVVVGVYYRHVVLEH